VQQNDTAWSIQSQSDTLPYWLLETELECFFERGLLLSSYSIYSQFKPRQMGAFILELVALEIAYHAGGLSNYETTNDDNGNDRSCKRSAVMRVCTTGEGNGSDLGAGGSGNEASGGEMEYDGRDGGYWSECGKGGRYGAQWADRRWWETGGLDAV
jgi:hypothetical protein